ncbi:MAG TPA: VTT domain-containing protein [Candidatus Saccharimonadales bacterium]|nr:VTT domain-containing protein [Candidatus Saccharimonadales bacterium]
MIELFSSHLTLFGSFFGIDLVEAIKTVSILGVIIIVFAESGLLIGAFLPGDTVLFTTGFLIYTGVLSFDIHLVVFLLFLAAVLGDSVGYTFGRRVGRKLFNRPDSRLFKQAYVEKAEAFYKKHGGKTIVLARFVPFVRTFAPVIAGTAKMSYRTFLSFNVIGALMWAVGITYLGYFLGSWFESMGLDIDQILLPAVFVIVFISIAPPAYHLLKEKEQRAAIWNGTKLQLRKIFNK